MYTPLVIVTYTWHRFVYPFIPYLHHYYLSYGSRLLSPIYLIMAFARVHFLLVPLLSLIHSTLFPEWALFDLHFHDSSSPHPPKSLTTSPTFGQPCNPSSPPSRRDLCTISGPTNSTADATATLTPRRTSLIRLISTVSSSLPRAPNTRPSPRTCQRLGPRRPWQVMLVKTTISVSSGVR